MPKSKFQQALEASLAEIPFSELQNLQKLPALNTLLAPLLTTATPVKTFSECTPADITKALELDLTHVRKVAWELPNDVTLPTLTTTYRNMVGRKVAHWNENAEATTRTSIDNILLEALTKQTAGGKALQCYGEVFVRARFGQKLHLNVKADYYLSYADPFSDDGLQSLLVAGEAKALGEARNIYQLIGYCGVIHRHRKAIKRPNATVYGFICDGAVWEFVRIDNQSVVWTSPTITEPAKILAWLGYVIECARHSSTSSSPAVSEEDLAKDANFEIQVERFATSSRFTLDDDEVDDEEEAEAYKRAIGRK